MRIFPLTLVLASMTVFGQAQIQVNARFVEYPAGGEADARVQAQLAESDKGIVAADPLMAMLVSTAGADILSAPKVTTVSGQKAQIKMVEERFFEADVPTEIGISLSVTPTLADSAIQLDLHARITEFLGFKETDKSPILRSRIIERKVSLAPGETVLLPGPSSQSEVVIEDCVPLLGSIPLLGRLFRCKTTETTTRNLLLIVSADLVQPDDSQ